LAFEAHGSVRRKSGELFIFHPLEVARIVVDEIGLGTTAVACALLHDVVEDTDHTIHDIEKQFGKKVAKVISGLTKIKGVFDPTKSEQAENYRRVILTMADDFRVVLVKIADRLHNMRTLDSMPSEKQLKIASETKYVYAPLAHRLGLYEIKSELEDLCFKYFDRKHYDYVSEQLRITKASRDRFVRGFVKPIEERMTKLDLPFEVKHRVKSISSIWAKMQKQGVTFEEVYDLFAIRIILDVSFDKEKSACWLTYSTVTEEYNPNPTRLRDWITHPKANGYESLHTTVLNNGKWIEIQIRTKRMDEVAEKGLAAHWKYKTQGKINAEVGLEMWVKEIREALSQKNISALDFINEFRDNLFDDEIHVFTPKGDIKTMRKGATALDFAFSIHSQIGLRFMLAKVNKKVVPLDHILKMGDIVEIVTQSQAKASEDWLRFVVTSKARTSIKEFLKTEKRKFMELGKEIIKRKFDQMKIAFDNSNVIELADFFEIKNEADLFYRIGMGTIDHTQIKKFKDARDESKKISKIESSKDFKTKMQDLNEAAELIVGENKSVMYSLAPCCNPVAGDEIFGLATVSRGIKIHRTNCPNAIDIMASFGHRIIRARWAIDKKEVFEVHLRIIGSDRMGLVQDVTSSISQRKVNIININFDALKGVFDGSITVSVHDSREIEALIQMLQAIEGVVRVSRYEL